MSSAPLPAKDKSYLRPLKRFNMSFSVNLKGATERIQDYNVWKRFLLHIMQMSLHNEWEREHGPSLDMMQEIPCEDIVVSLLKNRRCYRGVISWTSIECKKRYVAEYITESIIDPPYGLPNPFRTFNIHPYDMWMDDDPDEEAPCSDPDPVKN
jgi:hypothetical protein